MDNTQAGEPDNVIEDIPDIPVTVATDESKRVHGISAAEASARRAAYHTANRPNPDMTERAKAAAGKPFGVQSVDEHFSRRNSQQPLKQPDQTVQNIQQTVQNDPKQPASDTQDRVALLCTNKRRVQILLPHGR